MMAKNVRATDANSIEVAERAIRALQEKHDRASAARAEDDREMGHVSLAAHSGDAQASKKLDAIVERMLRRDLELKSITSAITQAQHNLADAKAAEARAGERRNMSVVRQLAEVLREAGEQADEALKELDEAAQAMRGAIAKLNSLGVNNPSAMQLQSLGSRALRTAIASHPWSRDFSPIAPRERRNFTFLGEWATSLEKLADAKIKSHKEGSSEAA